MTFLHKSDNSDLVSEGRTSYPALAFPAFSQSMLEMIGLLLIVFGDILFIPSRQVLSMFGADLSDLFIYNRYLGTKELLNGSFPLWNPYLFGGIPYFGLFDSALLYPPNAIFLLLPLKTAMNWNIVSHIFLLGLTMYLWAAYQGISRSSALLAGTVSMFCGPGFLHIFAGHLTIICAMPWAPLIFLAIDGGWRTLSTNNPEIDKRTAITRWGGMGAIAVCLQVLSGHPQIVFVTAIAAGLYSICKIRGNVNYLFLLIYVAAVYLAGAILSAVQITAGLAASQDSIRGGGVFYEFAAMCSFPPENLITLITPSFFGDMRHLPYWGRWYLWEMNLYIGVMGFSLLCLGLAWCIQNRRFAWPMVLFILLILSLGNHTPLFDLLYHYVPGFNWFRGSSKFILPSSLFISMIAAFAFDRIQQGKKINPAIVFACFAISFICVIGILFFGHETSAATPNSLWGKFLKIYAGTKGVYLPHHHFQRVKFISDTAYLSQLSLSLAAFLFVIVGSLFYKKPKHLSLLILLLLSLELVIFARYFRPSFNIDNCFSSRLAQMRHTLKSDSRILNIGQNNMGILYGIEDLWGVYPGVRRRYAEIMAVSQGFDADNASNYLSFKKTSKIFNWFRCEAIIDNNAHKAEQHESPKIIYLPSPLPRAFLVESYTIRNNKDDLLQYLTSPDFDPRQEVVLESKPDPEPWASGADLFDNSVRILDLTTDHIDMAVDTPRSAILVVTDTFSHGWRAVSLAPRPQQDYVVMPANYAMRAIPLRKGYHKIRLEYRPPLIKIGLVISLSGWAFLLLLGAMLAFRRIKQAKTYQKHER